MSTSKALPSTALRIAGLVLLFFAGCRGQTFHEPPRHLFDDMDWQPRYRPEAESDYFDDRRAMRSPIEDTVARGELRESDELYRGLFAGTQIPVATSPVPMTRALLARGHERFDIYCAPCHDQAGSGKGIVALRGFQPPPSNLGDERIRKLPDGEIYRAIALGVRNMPSYAAQIPVEDRWAIASWVRVLQRSQHATLADVPANLQSKIEPASTGSGPAEGAVK